jgi:hypothetical protein
LVITLVTSSLFSGDVLTTGAAVFAENRPCLALLNQRDRSQQPARIALHLDDVADPRLQPPLVLLVELVEFNGFGLSACFVAVTKEFGHPATPYLADSAVGSRGLNLLDRYMEDTARRHGIHGIQPPRFIAARRLPAFPP